MGDIPGKLREIPTETAVDFGPSRGLAVVTPTQVRRPGRSAFRTFVQALIPTILALGLVVPEVVKIILDETGETMPEKFRLVLLGISGAVAAVAAILARIMAIPAVEVFLRKYLPRLSAAPKEK